MLVTAPLKTFHSEPANPLRVLTIRPGSPDQKVTMLDMPSDTLVRTVLKILVNQPQMVVAMPEIHRTTEATPSLTLLLICFHAVPMKVTICFQCVMTSSGMPMNGAIS